MTDGPINGQELLAVKRLIVEGIIPPFCRRVTFNFAVNKVATMILEVEVTGEQMEKIADALADNPEEAKAIAREIIFVEPVSGDTAGVKL